MIGKREEKIGKERKGKMKLRISDRERRRKKAAGMSKGSMRMLGYGAGLRHDVIFLKRFDGVLV